MIFGTSATHALRALAYLAANEHEEAILGRDLAEEIAVPGHYLAKVLATLSRAGLLSASRGARGGYRLARRPEDDRADGDRGAVRGQAREARVPPAVRAALPRRRHLPGPRRLVGDEGDLPPVPRDDHAGRHPGRRRPWGSTPQAVAATRKRGGSSSAPLVIEPDPCVSAPRWTASARRCRALGAAGRHKRAMPGSRPCARRAPSRALRSPSCGRESMSPAMARPVYTGSRRSPSCRAARRMASCSTSPRTA